MKKIIQKIKNYIIKLYTTKPNGKEDIGGTPLCPKCQKGFLLEVPKEIGVYKYICQKCYIMVSTQELENAVKNNYVDIRPEDQKYFDAVLEQQNKRTLINKDMIKRGKRIVKALKQHEKEKNNKSKTI